MTRPRAEIMHDLKAILAELSYSMEEEDKNAPDISPKLAQALDQTRSKPVDDQTIVPRETHEDIRAKARAYRDEIQPNELRNAYEKPERLKDYTPADDPEWDNSPFLGKGDQA